MRGFFKICIVLLVLSNTMYGQSWLWSKPQNVSASSYLKGNVRLGNSGNLVSFLSDNTSTHLIFSDAFGHVIWNKYLENIIIKDVNIDSFDNIYFAGSFTGETGISGRKFRSQGNSDAIIGVLDKNGMLIKAQTFGGNAEEAVNSIFIHGFELYATGHFHEPLHINSVVLNGDAQHYNTFILKFDLDLTALKGIETSSGGSSGIKIAVDKYDGLYVLGNANYSLGIGPNSVGMAGSGQYITKLNTDLHVLWLQSLTSEGFKGYYKPYIFFDLDANFMLGRVKGDSDNILAVEKFDPMGSLIWSTNVKINFDDVLDMDHNCNIYAAGAYSGKDGAYELSVVKINPAGVASTLIYNNETMHRIKGLAVTRNKEFYINYSCGGNTSLDPESECEPDAIYMARYGNGLKNISARRSITQTFKIRPYNESGTVVINCHSGKKQNCVLLVKNTLGEIVYLDPMKEVEGNYSKAIDMSSQPKGVYYIEMRTGHESNVEKLVLQ